MDSFLTSIYIWYNKNKRDLPWRNTSDPYKIWLSEIILQQTRVAQGTQYYLRFIEAFPTVNELAAAQEDEILKLWQGLGYYSRARNLHAAAKTIVEEHQSEFPKEYKQILNLKGIGPYTAAAIASIAYGLPYPVVDGNVYRFLSRYFGIETPIDSNQGKKEFQELAEELIPDSDPGLHNQALMEFGALHCTPKSPKCTTCPIQESCVAFQKKKVDTLPKKSKKVRQRNRFFYYYLLDMGNTIVLEKRTGNDIWKNLYQLPLFESTNKISDKQLMTKAIPLLNGATYNIKEISAQKKHVLSHQVIYARLIYVETGHDVNITKPLIQVNKKDISKFAVPRLIELLFEDLQLNE